jgi:hypothetical protein
VSRALTPGEQLDLRALEQVVTSGLWTFIEVGEALLEIHDRKLYRATHSTWDAYLRGRWNLSRTYAHRLMQGAEVAGMLPTGNTPPSEGVARELAPLRDDPDQVREAWAEVVERHGDSPTAAETRAVVNEKRAEPLPAVEDLPTVGDVQHERTERLLVRAWADSVKRLALPADDRLAALSFAEQLGGEPGLRPKLFRAAARGAEAIADAMDELEAES